MFIQQRSNLIYISSFPLLLSKFELFSPDYMLFWPFSELTSFFQVVQIICLHTRILL